MRPPILIALLCFAHAAFPEPASPLLTRNQSPPAMIYGLPAPTAARLPSPGTATSAWSLNMANTINVESTGNEQLLFDGETVQFNLFAGYGVSENWSVHAQVPFIRHDGGILDHFIEEYHDLFGFSQGYRTLYPQDRLLYHYRRDGIDRITLTGTTAGIGDVQVMAARRLHRSSATDLSLWLGLKLPTGEAAELTGSGAADLSAWGAARHSPGEHWQVYGTAGILAAGRGDVLGELQEKTVLFGSAGLQWQLHPRLAAKFQFEGHTAFYENTGMRFLGDVLQLTFGGSWQTGQDTFLDIAVAEDIKRDASPDVNFNITLRVKH